MLEFRTNLAYNEQHRPTRRAMFSAWQIFFAILLVVGLGLLAVNFTRYLNTTIPGKVFSVANLPVPVPTRIKIPSIGVDADVTNLGLNLDGTLQVPKVASQVGWYTGGPAPGAVGPAVMVGHLDSARGPEVFAHLKNLKPGDLIEIDRQDGSKITFKVDDSQVYSQNNFPTDKVYSAINYPGLRLITCSGIYRAIVGHYSDNLVVYATLQN